MTGAPDHHDTTTGPRGAGREPVRYPTNHVIGIIDDRERLDAAVTALTNGGFMESEVQVGTGVAAADDLGASSGRTGLAGLLIRLADSIGAADEEMETKRRFEQAMRDNRFVLSVVAPTDQRKEEATRILREHGAHTVAFFGKHTIEYITPPRAG